MTQDEEDDAFSYETPYDKIARLLGERETYPNAPKKPSKPKEETSYAYEEYAKNLKDWEREIQEHESACSLVEKHNDGIETHVENYIKKEAGLRGFNQAQQDILWHRAWDKGHSSGYSEVYTCLSDLVDFINEFNNAK